MPNTLLGISNLVGGVGPDGATYNNKHKTVLYLRLAAAVHTTIIVIIIMHLHHQKDTHIRIISASLTYLLVSFGGPHIRVNTVYNNYFAARAALAYNQINAAPPQITKYTHMYKYTRMVDIKQLHQF